MLLMEDLKSWLVANGVKALVIYDGRPWEEMPATSTPDMIVRLTPAPGGLGRRVEEANVDDQTILVECRGPQNDPAEAERLAWQLDTLITGSPWPADVGQDSHVIMADRVSAPPGVLGWQPSGQRTVFGCQYAFVSPPMEPAGG
jgi:hypothetical protein